MGKIIIVDVFTEIVSAMQPALTKQGIQLNFIYGRQPRILDKLVSQKKGITTSDYVYPLLVLFQPFPETMGGDYYATVKFPKVSIAALANKNDYAPDSYNRSFKPILYPIYDEFLRQVVRHRSIVIENADYIPHTKTDIPGDPPFINGNKEMTDYFDSIVITDFSLTFKQSFTSCIKK